MNYIVSNFISTEFALALAAFNITVLFANVFGLNGMSFSSHAKMPQIHVPRVMLIFGRLWDQQKLGHATVVTDALADT